MSTSSSPGRRRTRSWGAVTGVLLVGLLALGFLVTRLGGLLPSAPQPFPEETRDRTPPAVLQSLADLSRYQAATGRFQVVVDVERDVRNLPSFLAGERTLFLAQGDVDAFVDFAGLAPESVVVSEDRRTVTVTLPPAQLGPARIDAEGSRVLDRDRGALDRVGGLFSDAPTSERELYLRAEDRLEAAARETELARQAEDNTRGMLTSLLTSLGFTDVRVEFDRTP